VCVCVTAHQLARDSGTRMEGELLGCHFAIDAKGSPGHL